MENLNRVQLRGVVGTAKFLEHGEKKILRMCMATNYAYRDSEGCAVIETTWHTVIAYEKKDETYLDSISKGSKVEVVGRLRSQRYDTDSGESRYLTEVVAKDVKILDSDETLEMEM